MADFFYRPPTLKASNFAALQSRDSIFTSLKDLNLLKKHIKNQEAGSILMVFFVLSKQPHFHRAYLVTVHKQMYIAVSIKKLQNFSSILDTLGLIFSCQIKSGLL